MRNFKKFLALVLAMLMVSACAVSVSAFDDVAAGDKYASAIELLADLEVIKGRGDGKFYPNDTLTREEAAVVAAKLIAGANAPEWVATTTSFVDVEDEWSFAYINYAAKYKAMEGVGNNKFEPKRELQIDEALKIALAVADPNALRQATIDMNTNPTGYWADHFIIAASKVGVEANGPEAGLLKGIATIRDYEAPCTRGMFAQIMENAFNFGDGIMEGFGYKAMKATVSVSSDGKYVTLTDTATEDAEDPITVTDALFAAALKAEGYDKITAADLANGSYIYVVCLEATKEIASIEVLTAIDVVNYTADKIKVVKNSDDTLNTTAIEIDGVKYTVNADDTTTDSEVWGEASTSVSGIKLYVDGANKSAMAANTIPAYYEASLYDDNGDGDYERAYITSYVLVTLTKSEDKVDHDAKADTDPVNATVIKQFKADGSAATKYIRNDRYLTVDGAGYTAWGETPVLANITVVDTANVSAKILETAVKVTGTVSGIKADTYITIDGKNINFAAGYADPDSWILGQKVSVYTIGGKYVSVASADTGVESGMVEKNVRVDNVVVENGNAIITGFVGNTFEAITLKVVGVAEGEGAAAKLLAKTSYEKENKVKVGADGKLDANGTEKAFAGQVAIIKTTNDAGAVTDTYVEFEDGKNYVFCVTSAGAYYKAEADEFNFDAAATTLTPAEGSDKNAVEFKNGYIYVDGTAQYKLASSFIVVTPDPASDTEHGFYDDTVKIEADKNIVAVNAAQLALLDASIASVSAGTVDKTVAVVYVKSITNPTSTAVVVDKLAEGQTIVQIASKESESLTYNTYNAIDLFTGEKVTVTGTATDKKFYVVKDGAIVEEAKWVANQNVTSETVLDMQTIKAYNTKLVDGVLTPDGDIAVFGIDAIKVWKTENGIIKEAGARADAIADKYNGTVNVLVYIDNGQMIIIK